MPPLSKWFRLALFALCYLALSAYIQRITLSTVADRIAAAVADLESRIAAEHNRRASHGTSTSYNIAASDITTGRHGVVNEFRRQMQTSKYRHGGRR